MALGSLCEICVYNVNTGLGNSVEGTGRPPASSDVASAPCAARAGAVAMTSARVRRRARPAAERQAWIGAGIWQGSARAAEPRLYGKDLSGATRAASRPRDEALLLRLLRMSQE